jgi:hypothetical protein
MINRENNVTVGELINYIKDHFGVQDWKDLSLKIWRSVNHPHRRISIYSTHKNYGG